MQTVTVKDILMITVCLTLMAVLFINFDTLYDACHGSSDAAPIETHAAVEKWNGRQP